MNIQERMQAIVDYSGKSIPQLANAVGFKTPQTIRSLLKGDTKTISDSVVMHITSYYPEVNADWLLTGEGEMLKSAVKEAAASIPTSTVSLEKLYALIEQLVKQGEMNAEANLRNAKANEQNAANIARLIDGYMGGYKGAEERKIG